MIEYIKRFAEMILGNVDEVAGIFRGLPSGKSSKIINPIVGISNLVQELNRLDPRDFEAAAQTEFVRVRANLEHLSENKPPDKGQVGEQVPALIAVLDFYRGPGSRGCARAFTYIADADLRRIIERDYAELRVALYPAGAWKSSVVIAGSILEAVLFDRIADPKWNTKALASGKAPKKPLEEWKLVALIDVAVDIKMLPKDPAETIHQVLRDYRNFVHPKKEIRSAHACGEAEAMLAIGALDSVCNYIEAHP